METLKLKHVTIMGDINQKTKTVFMARDKFIVEYCEKKGWENNPGNLKFEQILEIRKQDGWKNPKAT